MNSKEYMAEAKAPEYRLIGKSTSRIDGREIVTGRAKYTQDVKLRGMLIGKILRSPRAAAEVVSIDLAPALAVPGVMAAMKLAEGKVRYAGQQVAAVAAVDERTAEKALALIKVDYKSLPYVVDWEKARDASAPQVRDGKPNVETINEYSRGDVEKGFAEADVVVEHTYRTGFEVHNPTETHGSVAAWEGDHLVVYDSTQNIHGVRDGLARALKVPAANVTVIKNYMGGGFGSKLGANDYTIVAANLAREAGRPGQDPALAARQRRVRRLPAVVLPDLQGRGEEGRHADRASADQHRLGRRRVRRRGRGTRRRHLQVPELQGLRGDGLHEHRRLSGDAGPRPHAGRLRARKRDGRAGRGAGHGPARAPQEELLDEEPGRHGPPLLDAKASTSATSSGPRPSAGSGATASRAKAEGAGPLRRGIGVATSIWFGAGVPGTLADIVLYPDMSVEVVCGTQDLGTGTRTHMAVVAAETLGLEPKDITVKLGNSDYPWAPASGGSQTTPSVAPAVRDAGLKAVERLKAVAAARLKVEAADIVMADRKFSSKSDPAKSAPFADVYRDLRRETVFHGERGGMPTDQFAFNTFGAHFAEVEVNVETGRVRVLKYAAAQDSGQIVSKLTAESQVVGGHHPGPERRPLRRAGHGRRHREIRSTRICATTRSRPRSIFPEITPIFVDVVDPRINNLGVKGLGEPARVPSSAAIANAVYNAIGVHVREIPMTPKRVLEALKRKESAVMRDFKIAEPRTADELAALLAETAETTALIAGGTDLIDELKSGVATAALVVDLRGVDGLAGIAKEKDGLRIGAMTRVVDLAEDAAVARDYPGLKEAALSLATPQLRNVGTVGGNLCQRPRCWYYRDPEVVCRKKGGFNCYAYQGRNKYHASSAAAAASSSFRRTWPRP